MKPQLIVVLGDNEYRALPLWGGGWRLAHFGGSKTYDLAVAGSGVTCTCPAHRYRNSPTDRCKLGEALAQVGLINPHAQNTEDTDERLDGSLSRDREAAQE